MDKDDFKDILNHDIKNGDAYFGFALSKDSDGTSFEVILNDGRKEYCVIASYESIDAYIYSLNDLKQRLELIRIKEGK
jgi:hypothetical protein